MYKQPEYDATKTLLKFVVLFLSGTAAAGILTTALGGLPDSIDELLATWPMVVVAIASGLLPALKNFTKHFR